eukprot:CAMPEP_0172608898 /NCGR_PEP_ID=MMETSP1068-20121228/28940_1 /TAXON_ID=35684 /ORGANISM="Pseudopedinella elastica, Strain CCMP716" /LENGTH=901 /DNA_ID=CAMNT_0013412283 /DNA_START=100 /DNA_END=2805 /DNA_ORIENTATION=-
MRRQRQKKRLAEQTSRSSDESDHSDDGDNHCGPGGKWEFLGDPIKKSARKKYYDSLKVFNGDIVHVDDDVLLSAEEGMPPYIARILSMWEEKGQAAGAKQHYISARWYFRPKDIPKTVLGKLPNGKPVPMEVFYSDMTEDNDVRSVLGSCIISPETPSRALADNEYVCRFEYIPSEKRFKPHTRTPRLDRPTLTSPVSGSKRVRVANKKQQMIPINAQVDPAAPANKKQQKLGNKSTASKKMPPRSLDTSSSTKKLPDQRGPPLAIKSSSSSDGDGSVGVEGPMGSGLLTPRTGASGSRIECSRVGKAYQAHVDTVDKCDLSGATGYQDEALLMQRLWVPIAPSLAETGATLKMQAEGLGSDLSNEAILDFLEKCKAVHGLKRGDIVRVVEESPFRPDECASPWAASSSSSLAEVVALGVKSNAVQWGIFIEDVVEKSRDRDVAVEEGAVISSIKGMSATGKGEFLREAGSSVDSVSQNSMMSGETRPETSPVGSDQPAPKVVLSELALTSHPDARSTLATKLASGSVEVPEDVDPQEAKAEAIPRTRACPEEAAVKIEASMEPPTAASRSSLAALPATVTAVPPLGAVSQPKPKVRILFPNRAGPSKILDLSRVRGRYDEPKALECLYAAEIDPSAGLERWRTHLETTSPPFRAWSFEEVQVLNSGVGRFGDDFRNIAPFLPAKTMAEIAAIYYAFFTFFHKSGDNIVQLFRIAEAHQALKEDRRLRQDSSLTLTPQQHGQVTGGGKKRGRPPKPKHESTSRDWAKAVKPAEKLTDHSPSGGTPKSKPGAKDGAKDDTGAPSTRWEGHGEEPHSFDGDSSDEEAGRVAASQRFLTSARKLMPGSEYYCLVELLVRFNDEAVSVTHVVADVMDLLKEYPKLKAGFQIFLPSDSSASRIGTA